MVSKLQFLNFLKSVFYFQESVQNVNWHSDFYIYTTEVLGFFSSFKKDEHSLDWSKFNTYQKANSYRLSNLKQAQEKNHMMFVSTK